MEKRFPCVAGTFYPAEKEKLKNIIEGFLNEVSLPQIKAKFLEFFLLMPAISIQEKLRLIPLKVLL